MNTINTIYENFLKELAEASSFEEKEYAMIKAYDELDEAGCNDWEKKVVWKKMLAAA